MKSQNTRKKKRKLDMIRLLCSCGKRVKVSIKFAGKVGKCPKCEAPIHIPSLKAIEEKLRKISKSKNQNVDFDIPSVPSLKEIVLDTSQRTQEKSQKADEESPSPVLSVLETNDDENALSEESSEEELENLLEEESPEAQPTDKYPIAEKASTKTRSLQQCVSVEAQIAEGEPAWQALPIDEELDLVQEAQDVVEEAVPAEIESFETVEEIDERDNLEGAREEQVYAAEEVSEQPDNEQIDTNIIIAEEYTSHAIEALPVSEEEANLDRADSPSYSLEAIDEQEEIVGGELLMKGKNALDSQNLDEALQYFCQCIVSQEDIGSAYYLRGLVYLKKKAWDIAIEDMENARICSYSEEDVEKRLYQIKFLRAIQYRNISAYSEALADLEQIITTQVVAEKGKVYWSRAKFLMRYESWDTALEDIEKAIQHNYLKPQVYEAGGKISLYKRDYESAMNYFTAAFNRGGKNTFLYHARSEANFFLGNFEEALNDVHQAQNLSPEVASLYDLEGLILNEQNKYKESDQAFERSLGLESENPNHYFNRGIALMRRGKYAQAIEDFSRVLRMNPKDRMSYLKRAICYQEKINPNLAQAREDFKKVEELESEAMYRGGYSVAKS